MRAVIIKVRGAGVFGDPRLSKPSDYVFDDDTRLTQERKPRESAPYLQVPSGKLAVKFVANLLRVFCGERPVPSIRKVRFIGDPFYESLARKARVTINKGECSAPVKFGGNNKGETFTARKAIGGFLGTGPFNQAKVDYFLDGKWVSIKGGLIYWDRLQRFLGDILFNDFVAVANKLLGRDSRSEMTAQQAIEFMNTKKTDALVTELCGRLLASQRKPMANLILNGSHITKGKLKQDVESFTIGSDIGKPLNALMVCGGVEQINKFDCEISVPVSDEELKNFSKGTGVATFLEGGVACIDHIEDWSELIELQTEPTVEGELCTPQK
jgi:hypothetical protein